MEQISEVWIREPNVYGSIWRPSMHGRSGNRVRTRRVPLDWWGD